MGELWSRIIVVPDMNKEEKEGEGEVIEQISNDEFMKNEYLENIKKRYKIIYIYTYIHISHYVNTIHNIKKKEY